MFDNIIKQKTNNHEAHVPPGAWDNIIKKEKKRRFTFFWWTAGILLCAFSLIGYYKISNTDDSNKIANVKDGNRQAASEEPGRRLQTPGAVGSNDNTQHNIVSNKKINEENKSAIEKPGRRFQSPTAVGSNDNKQNPIVINKNTGTEKGNRQSANKPGRRLKTPTAVGSNNNKQNPIVINKNTGTEIGNRQSANEPGRRLKTPAAVGSNDNKQNTIIPNEKINAEIKIVTAKPNNTSSKDKLKTSNKPVDQTTVVSLAVKTKPSSHKTKIETAVVNKDEKQKNDDSFAKKANTVKKENGRSTLTVQPGETGDDALTENKKSKKDIEDVAVNEPVKNNDGQKIANDSKEKNNLSPTIKKELVVDSTIKTLMATTPIENKKEKNAVNKPAKKHAWFIDAGVSPVLPIQQYDKAVTFDRKQVTDNNTSVFSGKLASTSMNASVAYSIVVRRELSKKFFVGLGLQYLKLNEQITISGTETNTKYTIVDRLINSVGGPQLVSDTVVTVTEGNRKIAATNSYTFLTVPVFIQYDFIKKQSWSLGVVAGAYINVYGKYINEINRNHDAQLTASTQSNNEKSSIGAALYGGFRFGKRINKRLELFGTPSLTWALGRQNIKNSLINKKIQQAGFNIGLSYKLK